MFEQWELYLEQHQND